MAKHWNYFMFLLWICYLIVAGILMFTRGFLLRRDAFMNSSTCIPYSNIPCTPAGSTSVNITNGHEYHCTQQDKLLQLLQDVNSASKLCFPKKAKVILLVIDALRYDFATYDPELENPAPFQNKLPIIHDMLTSSNNAKMYKFIADPPTTTMQRLKALTTGGLPTFIDAGANFASPEITEDNILDQLLNQNENIVFMGDDTWSNLYPKRFIRSWPYPSFNVFDLDTVDYGIIKHLFNEIPKDDWSLLIAHFLGVDHCGHRYGPYHSEMERKLTEINNVIKNVISTMDNDTILYVIGDHGMTTTGDHGGETELEVTATLFIYSPTSLISFDKQNTNTVKQVDLIPTLAATLGIPVPYSNLGSLILDAFPAVNNSDNLFSNWQRALLALWSNVEQITNYINKYSETSNQLSNEKLNILKMRYSVLNSKLNNINNAEQFMNFAIEVKDYLYLARETCEEVWIQFDSFSMSRGLLILFLTIFFVYMISDGIPSKKLSEILFSSFILCSYIMMLVAGLVSFVLYYFSIIENFELTLFFSTGMISVLMLAIVVIQNWETIAIHWYECTKVRHWLDVVCRCILLLFLCTIFSNSFILEEASVLSYLSLSIIYFIIYNSITQTHSKFKSEKLSLNHLKPKWSSLKTKLVLLGLVIGILIRFSKIYWRCREEQKWCTNYSFNTEELKSLGPNAEKIQCIITLVFLALFVTITRIWLRSCGNLVGFSPTVTLARYAPSVMVVCSAGFWILHRLPKEQKSKLVSGWQIDILAWTVYALVFLGILSVIIQPLCVYVLPKRKETVSVYGQDNIIPQIFNHVKELYQDKQSDKIDDDMPIVYGLGTVYSATFTVVSIFVCILISLLMGDGFAPSTVVMYFTAAFVLAVLSISHYEKVNNISQLFDVPSSMVLCWVLLSHYFFYGTGHQPSFPLIHWEAAFVGTGGNFIHNAIPATLIGINTFGSYILMGLTFPLLIIGPFTLYIMFPNLAPKNDNKNLRRGELILFENDSMLIRGIFSVGCKYILFHGIRMFTCMLAVTIHCRHLMVWSIFAPKLIFEGIGIMVSLASVLISYLLLIRVNNKVEKLITSLEKQNR